MLASGAVVLLVAVALAAISPSLCAHEHPLCPTRAATLTDLSLTSMMADRVLHSKRLMMNMYEERGPLYVFEPD